MLVTIPTERWESTCCHDNVREGKENRVHKGPYFLEDTRLRRCG